MLTGDFQNVKMTFSTCLKMTFRKKNDSGKKLWRRTACMPRCAIYMCNINVAFHPVFEHRHSNTLQHSATYCNTLQHTATSCLPVFKFPRTSQQPTATRCNTLQHTATPCNKLFAWSFWATSQQHAAPHCNILQHTAEHSNTLQHTATHCNKLFACLPVFEQRDSFFVCQIRHSILPPLPHLCCSVLQCVLQCVAVCVAVWWYCTTVYSPLWHAYVAVCCSVCCSVLQCVLQCDDTVPYTPTWCHTYIAV